MRTVTLRWRNRGMIGLMEKREERELYDLCVAFVYFSLCAWVICVGVGKFCSD